MPDVRCVLTLNHHGKGSMREPRTTSAAGNNLITQYILGSNLLPGYSTLFTMIYMRLIYPLYQLAGSHGSGLPRTA